jgi:NAD(P) transhydrogenase
MFVIGTGPAGQRAAVQAAKLGKRVGICERRDVVGGVCINTGTIPSKTFREAVLYLTGFRQRGIYGSSFTVKEDISMADLLFRCSYVIEREIDVIRHQMRRNRVQVVDGEARFLDQHNLAVTGRQGTVSVQADHVVIAAGTTPAQPSGFEAVGNSVIDSDGILGLSDIPRTMTIVGAGVIGIEYASIFAALGSTVTIVERSNDLLDFADREIVEALVYHMRNLDCIFRLGEEVEEVMSGPGQAVAKLKSGKTIVSELLLYSTGRVGATAALDLRAIGLSADERGRLAVDEHYRTSQSHIYAVGDVVGFPSLASTSMEQGRIAACHAFGLEYHSSPDHFPYGIYAVPELSMVGQTEQELTAAAVPYEVGLARYREIARGNILGDDTGMLKLLFHRETRRLLGVHIIGAEATELVHIGQAVLAFDGTLEYFVNTVFNYPTLAECYKVAALDCYNKIGPPPGETSAH